MVDEVYVPVVFPMTFDQAEAARRRETYETRRREYTQAWRDADQQHQRVSDQSD